MSAEEDRIQKQIRPCIEKMVMELTRKQPKDVVSIKIILNKIFLKIGKIHDRLVTTIWRLYINRVNHRRKKGIRISSFTGKKISCNGRS
jgi:hypothetical protein